MSFISVGRDVLPKVPLSVSSDGCPVLVTIVAFIITKAFVFESKVKERFDNEKEGFIKVTTR